MLNLLNEASKSKIVTRKGNIVNDQSNANYDVRNEIIYNTEVPIFVINNDHYILITTRYNNLTQVAFKNCAPFLTCITKIDGTAIDYTEDSDLVMPMYNLIEYSSNYSDTTGSLWFYSKDETTTFNVDIANI